MKAWLLAGFILILCAIGVYYIISPDLEGFVIDPSGSLLKKQAEAKCETDYRTCLSLGSTNLVCTTAYNNCNTAAQKLDGSVSTIANAPGSSTQYGSSVGAIRYATGLGATGAGDATTWARSGGMLNTQTYGSSNPSAAYLEAVKRTLGLSDPYDYTPSTIGATTGSTGSTVRGIDDKNKDISDLVAEYLKGRTVIYPHETPPVLTPGLTATVRSDSGTGADYGANDGSDTIRTLIRRDINKAVHDVFEEDNEYEITYE